MRRLIGIFAAVAVLLAGLGFVGVEAQTNLVGPAFLAYERTAAALCQSRERLALAERRYDHLVLAMEKAGYGRGRGSNFWGPLSPEQKTANCQQSGGADGGGAASAE